jgi:MFS family permease
LYFIAMMAGAFGYRVPPPGWSPGENPIATAGQPRGAGHRYVPVAIAWRTRQFWLLWAVLCLNVSAGIGILGIASPMVQEIFRGRVTASAAAGFAGLLSLFNILGRIFWASLSDWLGRRATYTVFFALGAALYASVPLAGASGGLIFFIAIFCVALTMYGGGFATVPAYLADLFGTVNVSAIHGRLLTAWSTAGILGPVLVNYIREFQIARGVAPAQAYTVTMYVLAGLLIVGFFCNLAITAVPDRLFVGAGTEPAIETALAAGAGRGTATVIAPPAVVTPSEWGLVVTAWTLVGVPLVWGVFQTLSLARQMMY